MEAGDEAVRAGLASWIENYGGEEFAEVVSAIIALTDRLGPQLSPTLRASAARHFAITSPLRVDVRDMRYRRERWPI